MQLAKTITITAFAKQEENEQEIESGLKSLAGVDLEKEKLKIHKKNATGFNERRIIIMELRLEKARHTNQFLKSLLAELSDEQKQLIVRQAESRLDDGHHFFIRLDKEKLLKESQCWITDEGNCYHIKMALLCFPKNRANAIAAVKQIFK